MADALLGRDEPERLQDVADVIAITRVKGHQGILDDALVLAAEPLADQFLELLGIEAENLRDQPKRENILALVAARAADRLDGCARDRHADVVVALVLEVRLHVVGIVKQNASFAKTADVVLVGMLVEGDQEIGVIARRKDVSRSDVNLENAGAAGDRRRNRHVRHHVLGAAAGKPRKKPPDGLDAVL